MADEIQSFQWTGINRQGKRLKGQIKALDMKAAEIELKNSNVDIISLSPKAASSLTFSFKRNKVKNKNVVLFTRYLSTMLSAGMPILQALDIIARDPDNVAMQAVVISVRNNVTEGKTLADSFALYPAIFDKLYCNLVKAGEKSGTLDKILKQLSIYLERIETMKRKIKKALIYPVAVVSVAMIVSAILLLFVMPQFKTMFAASGVQLPLFTRMVMGLSDSFRAYWWLVLIVMAGSFFMARYLLNSNEKIALKKDEWILRLYIFGPILKKSIIARFSRTLGITLDAGLPIVDSLKSMVDIMGNRVYSNAINLICEEVTSGHQLYSSMAATNVFPNMPLQMIYVGEQSGNLAQMLYKIADYYEEEVNLTVDNLNALLEPIILVVLGVIIGSFVIAMYLPIFKLGSIF